MDFSGAAAKSFLAFLAEWTDRPWLGTSTPVPGVRFELTRPCGQRVLSPPRLPFRHPGSASGKLVPALL